MYSLLFFLLKNTITLQKKTLFLFCFVIFFEKKTLIVAKICTSPQAHGLNIAQQLTVISKCVADENPMRCFWFANVLVEWEYQTACSTTSGVVHRKNGITMTENGWQIHKSATDPMRFTTFCISTKCYYWNCCYLYCCCFYFCKNKLNWTRNSEHVSQIYR